MANIVITKICQYCQLLVVSFVFVALNICYYWHILILECL